MSSRLAPLRQGVVPQSSYMQPIETRRVEASFALRGDLDHQFSRRRQAGRSSEPSRLNDRSTTVRPIHGHLPRPRLACQYTWLAVLRVAPSILAKLFEPSRTSPVVATESLRNRYGQNPGRPAQASHGMRRHSACAEARLLGRTHSVEVEEVPCWRRGPSHPSQGDRGAPDRRRSWERLPQLPKLRMPDMPQACAVSRTDPWVRERDPDEGRA